MRLNQGFKLLNKLFFLTALLSITTPCFSEIDSTPSNPIDANKINWVFTGHVIDDNGDVYNYFFQMQRNETKFNATAALFDAQTQQPLFQYSSDTTIETPTTNDWRVGDAFLHFNPINETWFFGVKTNNKQGFNFKVDLLKQPENHLVAQELRPGLAFIVSQTGEINGHILNGVTKQDRFVAASSAWFRQIWLTQPQEKSHQLSSVLCRFNDDSGFYSMMLKDSTALQGAVAGLFDKQGSAGEISQFIRVSHENEGPWHIQANSPSFDLVLSACVEQDTITSGFVEKQAIKGFCFLSHETI